MGLFGGGNSSTNTTVVTTNNYPTVTPQVNQAGALSSIAAISSPTIAGNNSSIGPTQLYTYYAPLTVAPSQNYGGGAIAAAQQTAQVLGTTGSTQPAATLSSIFSGDNIYWLLAGIALILFGRKL